MQNVSSLICCHIAVDTVGTNNMYMDKEHNVYIAMFICFVDNEKNNPNILDSIHNCTYFAVTVLQDLERLSLK